jgi:hypothetical protein
MSPTVVLALAVMAAIADVVVILTWLGVGPHHIFNRKWWSMEAISVSRRKMSVVLGLLLLSLSLSFIGLGTLYLHINFVPPKVVFQIQPIAPANMNPHIFTLRVPYLDVGAGAITEMKRGGYIRLSPNELPAKEEDRIRKVALENAKNADADLSEVQRLQTGQFFDITEKGVSDQDMKDVQGSKQWLYFSVVAMYRDENTPNGKYGVTETCGYFYGNFSFYHNCIVGGNRIYVTSD